MSLIKYLQKTKKYRKFSIAENRLQAHTTTSIVQYAELPTCLWFVQLWGRLGF